MTRHCPIHTHLRQTRICRFCRADTSGRIPLAYSERGPLELVLDEPDKLAAEPPKPSRAAGKRAWRQPRIAAILLLALALCGLLPIPPAGAQQNGFTGPPWSWGSTVRSSFRWEGGQ